MQAETRWTRVKRAPRRSHEHGEPQVAVGEVLPRAGVEEVLELEHLFAAGHWEQAVDLKWTTGGDEQLGEALLETWKADSDTCSVLNSFEDNVGGGRREMI